MKAKSFKIMAFSIAGVLIAILLAVSIACGLLSSIITSMLSMTKLDSAAREQGEKLATQIVEEGVVLTQNKNGVLPLDKTRDAKVNVFGWAGAHWLAGGSGSGRNVTNEGGGSDRFFPDTDLLEGLSNYGIEYNTELIDMYNAFLPGYPNTGSDGQQPNNPMITDTLHTHDYESCRLFEPNITDNTYYTDNLLDNAEKFSDVAIVVLSRLAGESNDAPMVQYKNYTKRGEVPAANTDTTRTYLDISVEEEALLTYVGNAFERVVVLINSTNAMNLGFTEQIPGIDACIVAGGTGINAVNGLIKVLYGEVSPSGRLTDTYVYDFSTAATFVNSGKPGVGIYTNSGDVYPTTTTNPNVGNSNNRYTGASYLDYAEGIYVGYRWYETADAEGFWDSAFANAAWGANGYDTVVQYPFGYGLSYTDFECNITDVEPRSGSALKKDDKIKITVRIHNKGSVAGKHVLQLYSAPPYTGKLEKSAINLVAIAKTPVDIEPDGYQDLTLELDAFDLASYDHNGTIIDGGAYVLEKGAYKLKLMKNSHVAEDMMIGANPVVSYSVDSDIKYTEDPVSTNPVKNIFSGKDVTDGFAVDGTTSGENIKYMTRADFEGTFPAKKTPDRAMSAELKAKVMYTPSDAAEWDARHADDVAPITGANGGLKAFSDSRFASELGLQLGANYKDSRWDDLLDQLTTTELDKLTLHGYIHEEELSSIGKTRTTSVDGPTQVGSFNVTYHGTGFPNSTVLAQTFNTELARSFGLALGVEAQKMSVSGLYAPGMNLHRSAFGGRNYEYFSEDPTLTGLMAAKVAEGSLLTGTYMYAKHIIGYDQESYRDGMYCWMTEQTLREIYLKPFKIAIDKGGLSGLMTSYGRIGAVWSGGSEALLTDLLRNEWDFRGAVITDYSDHQDFMNGDQMIRAGGDLWMDGYQSNGAFRKGYDSSSGAFRLQQRNAAKHILYMILNAQYISSTYDAEADGITITRAETNGSWWIALLVVGDVLLAAGAAVLIVFGIRKKDKK